MATYAPASLLDARGFLIANLDMHPGRSMDVDLDPDEVGIVGDRLHNGGYHHGWSQRSSDTEYSWAESPRDRNHRTEAARALDIGWFDVTINGRRITLIDFNRWVVAQCAAGAPDTLDIREVIYTLDKKTVRRWDRLGRRSSGDSSHLWHTHLSYFADTINNDKTALFRRFLAEATGSAAPGVILMAELTDALARQIHNADTYLWRGLTQLDPAVPDIKTAGGTTRIENRFATTLLGIADDVKAIKARPAAAGDTVDIAALGKAIADNLAGNAAFVEAIGAEVVHRMGLVAQGLANAPK